MSIGDIKFLLKLLLAVIGIVLLILKGDNLPTAIALMAFIMSMINSAKIDMMQE